MRYPEECEKQWRPKQGKLGWEKQRKEEKKEEEGKKREKRKERTENKKPKKERTIEVKKAAEEQEIWDKKEEEAKSEEEMKKLTLEKFHKWIHIFDKKASERIPTRKLQDYAIDMKEEFVLRKGKMYLLLGEERGDA